jgi:transcriptional regulator with XRE-family HTH domain
MIVQMVTFGERVRAALMEGGKDSARAKEELAKRLDISLSQVEKWLAPTANPRLENLFKLAIALQVSIEALCEGINPEYDAMRRRVAGLERFAEVWSRIDDPDARADAWRTLLRLAGMPTHPDDAGPPVGASSPKSLVDPQPASTK